MQKSKSKNDRAARIGMLPFVTLWSATYGVAWLAVFAIMERLSLSSDESNLVGIAVVTLVPAILQIPLVERLLKQRMRGWLLVTIAATLLTFLTFNNGNPSDDGFLLTAFSLFMPAALLQTLWLWRRVQSAWLWALASLVASVVFTLPIRDQSSTINLIIASLLLGGVQGVIMRYLWLQPKTTEKAKIAAADAHADVEDARLERLSTADHQRVLAPWSAVDAPPAQQRETGR